MSEQTNPAPSNFHIDEYATWIKECKKTFHKQVRSNARGRGEKVFKSFHGFDEDGNSEFAYFHLEKCSPTHYNILISAPYLNDDIDLTSVNYTSRGFTYIAALEKGLRWDGGRIRHKIEMAITGGDRDDVDMFEEDSV